LHTYIIAEIMAAGISFLSYVIYLIELVYFRLLRKFRKISPQKIGIYPQLSNRIAQRKTAAAVSPRRRSSI